MKRYGSQFLGIGASFGLFNGAATAESRSELVEMKHIDKSARANYIEIAMTLLGIHHRHHHHHAAHVSAEAS